MPLYRLNIESPNWGRGLKFGEALRSIRQNLGLTMEELSKSSGVSQSYISQLENDTRLPSEATVRKLAYSLSHIPAGEVDEHDPAAMEAIDGNTEDEAEMFESQVFNSLWRIRLQNYRQTINSTLKNEGLDTDSFYANYLKKENIKSLATGFENLSEEDQKQVLNFIDFLNSKNNK